MFFQSILLKCRFSQKEPSATFCLMKKMGKHFETPKYLSRELLKAAETLTRCQVCKALPGPLLEPTCEEPDLATAPKPTQTENRVGFPSEGISYCGLGGGGGSVS